MEFRFFVSIGLNIAVDIDGDINGDMTCTGNIG